MSTVEVKTAKLIGRALDWAVAKSGAVTVEDNDLLFDERSRPVVGGAVFSIPYRPSTNWAQGGPLIEKFHVQTSYNGRGFSTESGEYWCAYACKDSGQEEHPSGGGGTPLIAICRAIVQFKMGDTIQVPEELMP